MRALSSISYDPCRLAAAFRSKFTAGGPCGPPNGDAASPQATRKRGEAGVSVVAKKALGVGLAVAIVGVLIGLYVANFATSFPTPVASINSPVAGGGSNLTLETVAAVGSKFSPAHPAWVSYLAKSKGKWVHTTIFQVPAYSVIHVTIYQFDSPTGLRNPFLSQVQGTVGGTATLDGKTFRSIPAEEARTRSQCRNSVCSCRSRACRKKPRTRAKKHRAFRPSTITARSPSASRPAGRDASAGSASCPAARATCPATAGRCRRSATWTASSMWCSGR